MKFSLQDALKLDTKISAQSKLALHHVYHYHQCQKNMCLNYWEVMAKQDLIRSGAPVDIEP